MFEDKVQNILDRKAETEKLLKQLRDIYEPYERWTSDSKRDSIFYVDIRIDHIEKAEYMAKDYLRKILENLELSNRLRGQKCETVEQLAELVKGTTIDDFYAAAVQYIPHNKYKDYEFFTAKTGSEYTKMQYTESRVHYRKLELILNCLWLLNNEQPIDRELSQKIYKLAEDGKTFVFLGCKVTNYKNGNLKINFSDVKLFEEFKSRFNNALEEAKREYERKQNEKE